MNTTQKTIAFVSDAVYPYNKGGKETRLHEITTRLNMRGFDVHIYCMKWWEGKNDRIEKGVHLHAICPYIPLYSGSKRSILQGIVFGLSCLKLLTKKFDLVDVDHMPFFPLFFMKVVCLLKNKPMIATWHEVWGKEYWKTYLGGIKAHVAYLIEKMSVQLPTRVIAVSQLTHDRLGQMLGYGGEVINTPNGIDLKKIHEAPAAKRATDIIYAGRLLSHKNVDVLLNAVSLVRNKQLKVLIAGEGPEKVTLQRLSKTLSIQDQVLFLDFVDDIRDLYALMKSSKVFVLPSTREGFGLVVLEAYACGLKVITIDHPDNAATELRGVVQGITSSLKPADLAKSIEQALDDHSSTRLTRKDTDKSLLRYDWESVVETLIQKAYQKTSP